MDDINQQVGAAEMAWGTVKTLKQPLYDEIADAARRIGIRPVFLAVTLIDARWADAYADLTAKQRRRVGKTILIQDVYTATYRTN